MNPGFGCDIKSYKHFPSQVQSDQLQVQIPPGTYVGSSAPSSEPSSPRKILQGASYDRLTNKPVKVESYTSYGKFCRYFFFYLSDLSSLSLDVCY